MSRREQPSTNGKLIITRLMGGLGNQMFQYAAGRALALRNGVVLKLDLSHFETKQSRRFELDRLRIKASPAAPADLALFGLAGKRWPGRLESIRRRWRTLRPRPGFAVRREYNHRFDPEIAQLTGAVFLDGYWQSEKYFLDHADTLRQEFGPVEPPDHENVRLAAAIDAVHAVSVHVRRGDYVDDAATNRYHGTCPPAYYEAAVEFISTRIAAPHLFVFSDEPAWVRAHLHFGVPSTVVDINSPDDAYRDMQLMARCRHHICANSSFSWWGAWLNRAPGKIVVAPKRWFNVASIDTRDRVPENWVRL